jgi:uncharacterized linocin/CFP29 family protein
MVELRADFELEIWELDNFERGAHDLDLTEVVKAAKAIAEFEERAVYQGFSPAKISGMSQAAAAKNAPIQVAEEPTQFLDAISRARLEVEDQGVEGPFKLVVGPQTYQKIYGTSAGYPIGKQVERIIEGPIILSSVVQGGFLISARGGDAELTIGQDFSIGYEAHELKKVRLYITESFTFRVLNPKAIVELKMSGKSLEKGAPENHQGNGKIDHEPRHVYERGHKRR